MATPEGKVKNRVKSILEKHKVYYFMPVQNGMGAPGLDFHGCHKGRAFCVETKAPGKKLTARQEMTCRDMGEAGMKIFIVGERLERSQADGGGTYSGTLELEAWLLGLIS